MMLAPRRECSSIMTFTQRDLSPPKRPRLQIMTTGAAPPLGKSFTALKADVDPASPTAFNTLSNAYFSAIEKCSSPQIPAPNDTTVVDRRPSPLRIQTAITPSSMRPLKRTQTPGPFTITYPETPDHSTPTAAPETKFDSTAFTFTPPCSAGPVEQPVSEIFSFSSTPPDSSMSRATRRRASSHCIPYTHPRSLHSILRNSPLPPRNSLATPAPRRALVRSTGKKVGYNDPLEQTIITNKYVKSHIDLLSEDSPSSATDPDLPGAFDAVMQYTGDETRDGGQTPGPFEEMRRRMAESALETPAARRRKRKDKKRKWRWTIGGEEGEDPEDEMTTAVQSTPITTVYVGAKDEISTALPPDMDEEMDEQLGDDRDALRSEETTDEDMSDEDRQPLSPQSL